MTVTYEGALEAEDTQEEEPKRGYALNDILSASNIAEMLTEEELSKIGLRVISEYKIDEASRAEWVEKNKRALDLARQVAKDKTYPWPKAANVLYPLISEAAIQFNARAYPAIVSGKDIVKAKVQGEDPQGLKAATGQRVSRHMSYQLSEEMEEWETDTDRLLIALPILGSMFRKVWFDADLGRNRTEVLSPDELTINQKVKSFERAPRITQTCEYYPYEVSEKIALGEWRDVDLGLPQGTEGDDDAPHKFLEQHRRIDLDEDGYPEPYFVTVHEGTGKVMNIQPCFRPENVQVDEEAKVLKITPERYFVHYQFMPDPEGGFYGMGFGQLLYGTNKAINSTINQLMDAGHLASLGGGFIGRGASMSSGALQFKPGEWKRVDVSGPVLRDSIVSLPVTPPSPVLFRLLGMLIESGKSLASTKDILTGENVSSNMPATLGLAMIEQGLKVFTAIYKRIHRALHEELKLLFRLNNLYLNPETYFRFMDAAEQVGPQDYDEKSLNVVPVTDPTVVTDMQRLGKAQFLMQFRGDPTINPMEINSRLLQAANIEDIEKLVLPEPMADPRVKEAEVKANHDFIRLRMEGAETIARITELETRAVKNLADAEAAEVGSQLADYQARFNAIKQTIETAVKIRGVEDAGQSVGGGNPPMAGPADDSQGLEIPGGGVPQPGAPVG